MFRLLNGDLIVLDDDSFSSSGGVESKNVLAQLLNTSPDQIRLIPDVQFAITNVMVIDKRVIDLSCFDIFGCKGGKGGKGGKLGTFIRECRNESILCHLINLDERSELAFSYRRDLYVNEHPIVVKHRQTVKISRKLFRAMNEIIDSFINNYNIVNTFVDFQNIDLSSNINSLSIARAFRRIDDEAVGWILAHIDTLIKSPQVPLLYANPNPAIVEWLLANLDIVDMTPTIFTNPNPVAVEACMTFCSIQTEQKLDVVKACFQNPNPELFWWFWCNHRQVLIDNTSVIDLIAYLSQSDDFAVVFES